MPNRPNEFPPPPENVPEWAAYQPGMIRQYGHAASAGPAAAPPPPQPANPYAVPLPQGISPRYGYGPVPPGVIPVSYVPAPGSHKPVNGLAVTALVMGVLAATYGVTMFGGLVFGLLAIPFGIAGLCSSRSNGGSGKSLSWWGIALGIVGLTIAGLMMAAVGLSASEYSTSDDCEYYEEYDFESEYTDTTTI